MSFIYNQPAYCAQEDEGQGRWEASITHEDEDGDKGDGSHQVSGSPSRRNVLFQSKKSHLQAQTHLDASHHGNGYQPAKPIDPPRHGHQEHNNTDRESSPIEHLPAYLLGDNDKGDRLQGLHGHRYPIHQGRPYLHGPEYQEDTRPVETGDQDHSQQQGKSGPYVAEGPGQFVAVEPHSSPQETDYCLHVYLMFLPLVAAS